MEFRFWNGYGVDENGVIYNKDGSVKKLNINAKGYYTSNFYYNGRLNCHLAQKVVAGAWLGETPEGCEIDHKDNDRLNNHPMNLQFLTKSQNNQKAYDSGNRMFLFGDSNPNSLVRRGIRKRSETRAQARRLAS